MQVHSRLWLESYLGSWPAANDPHGNPGELRAPARFGGDRKQDGEVVLQCQTGSQESSRSSTAPTKCLSFALAQRDKPDQ
jgi:hypothetical protein